ncbi:MAG: hypothetical protein ACK5LE_04280 [Alphaproteobacteria bacterium]
MKLFLQRLTMFVFFATIICVMTTMALSWRTARLKWQQVKIEQNIEDVRTGLRVLEAEWSRLNQPVLLQAQAEKYLVLQKNMGTAQIDNILELPTKEEVAILIAEQKARDAEAMQNGDTSVMLTQNTPHNPPTETITAATPSNTNDIVENEGEGAHTLSEPIDALTNEASPAFDPINDILNSED